MQRLNIPFSRNTQTTRRTRWVVWLLVLGSIGAILLISWMSILWFTRDTIYSVAPENTIFVARFFTSGSKGIQTERILQNLPLVSNKGITLKDLSSSINGELAIFITKSGEYSLGIRANKPISDNLLSTQSIIFQTNGHHIYLLSDSEKNIKALSPKTRIFPGLSYPTHTWVGETYDTTTNTRSFIFASRDHIDIEYHKSMLSGKIFKKIPDNTIAYLSNPVWTNDSLNPKEFVSIFTQFISDKSIKTLVQNLASKPGQLILTLNNNQIGYYLSSETPKDLNVEQLIKTISSLSAPKIQETPLTDGTFIKEIIADPNSYTAEQITLFGSQIHRISTPAGHIYAGITNNQHVFLTNTEELYKSQKDLDSRANLLCNGNIGGFDLKQLNDLMLQHLNTPNPDPVLIFAHNFTRLGIIKSIFSEKIRFCY